MSTFISGVANPMTQPRKPHIRTPPKTPHSMITGAHKPKMTKEERQKFVERKREEWAAEAHGRGGTIGDAIKERTDAFVTHEKVPPVLDYGALERGDIQAVLGDKFDAILQEYGHKPLNKTPMKGTKNTGGEASVN
jgi:hypothetical protein